MAAEDINAFNHPLAEPLLRFNLLPSLLLHPAKAAQRLPDGLRAAFEENEDAIAQPVLHRHWSAALRRELKLPLVESFHEPALPVAMLEAALFEKMTQWCGIAMLAPSIRRTIARGEVATLLDALGEDGVAFAREDAVRLLPPSLNDQPPMALAADVHAQSLSLGNALLWTAFDVAPPAVATRGRLRLSPEADQAATELPSELSRGPDALALAEHILELLDPTWLSSFPTRH